MGSHPEDLMAALDYSRWVPAGLMMPPPARVLDGIVSYIQVPFAEVIGWRPVRLDVHVPAGGTGPAPVVIYLHGGSFLVGTSGMGPWPALVRRGVGVVSVSYRLAGEAPFPEPVEDVRAAVAWVRVNASHLGLDAENVALWGSSAGGYLALAAALAGPEPAGRPLRLIADPAGRRPRPEGLRYDVRGVIAHYPVTSPARLRDDAFDNSPAEIAALERALGVFFAGHDGTTVDLAARARRAAVIPPVLLLHGDQDHRVGLGQSLRLHAALRDLGAASQLEVIPRGDHGSAHFESPEVIDLMQGFLAACWGGTQDADRM